MFSKGRRQRDDAESRMRELQTDALTLVAEISTIRSYQNRLVSQDMVQAFEKSWQPHLDRILAAEEVLDAADQRELLDTGHQKSATSDSQSHKTAPLRLLTQSWDQIATKDFRPRSSGLGPAVIRVGELAVPLLNNKAEIIPALIPVLAKNGHDVNGTGHLAIVTSAANRKAALLGLQSAALRIIAGFPVRKARLTAIDSVGMGDTFPFKRLPDYITGAKIYTREDEIRDQLRGLTNHLEQVVQKYLAADFKDIEEFNEATSYIKEAYRFLFIADFPYGFDHTSLEDLKKLLANGPRAGVYVFMHIDSGAELPRDFTYEDFIFNRATVIRETTGVANNSSPFALTFPNGWNDTLRGATFPVMLDTTPSNDWLNAFAANLVDSSKSATSEGVPFAELRPEANSSALWERNSSRDLHVPIGLSGALDPLEFRIGEWEDNSGQPVTVNQALLAGKPGSGKSFTLHAIICNLALYYSPNELHLYLLDYKEGVEFRIYTDKKKSHSEDTLPRPLPHAQVVSVESEREFGLSVLRRLKVELERRGELFNQAHVNELKNYRSTRLQEILPRILLVIDEFQVLFAENDAISAEANRILEDIARRGRSFGLHMLLASQSPNIANMNRSLYSFIDLRMVMQLDKASASAALAEGNSDVVDLLERPGEIVINSQAGRREGNVIGQVANMTPVVREEVLDAIQVQQKRSNYQRPTPLIIFRGNEPSRLVDNGKLAALLKRDNWSKSFMNGTTAVRWRDFFGDPDWVDAERPAVGWVGEAIRIGAHAGVTFRRRARSNLLIVGSDEASIFGMIGGVLISITAFYPPAAAQFCFIDLSQPEEQWSDLAENFSRYMPHTLTVGERYAEKKAGEVKVFRAEDLLDRVNQEIQDRKHRREVGEDERTFSSIYFIVGGLHRFQQLRPVIGQSREEPSEKAKILNGIVSQGAELGVHTILWVDSMKTFERTMQSRAWLTQFDLRAALTIPAEDSQMLFGEASASKLPHLRGYIRDESSSANLEKFKPYSLPDANVISVIGAKMKQWQKTNPQQSV